MIHVWAAIFWLGVLFAFGLFYLLGLIRRSPYTMWENVLYTPTYLWGRLLWRVRFCNDPPAEMTGGAVLVANHKSSVDPFFVQLSAGRRVHWMVAKEYCENPIFGPLLRALQAIPTNRSGMDTGATKLAIRLAKEGRLVGMFPEGRLNHSKNPLVSIRTGAALVAARAGVPIIPIFILGSPYRREVWSPLSMPACVKITFGTPIDPISFAHENAKRSIANLDLQPNECDGDLAVAERMMLGWGKQIVTMAGRPDWPVEIAGRSRLNRNLKVKT